jgi:hypothetical protein
LHISASTADVTANVRHHVLEDQRVTYMSLAWFALHQIQLVAVL